MKEPNWADNVWFLSRVVVGWMIHVFLIACSFFNLEVVYNVVKFHYIEHQRLWLQPQIVAFVTSVSFLLASMSGVFWVKQLYIRYALPEVMDEITRKILK